jgi:hypothetical protein
MESQDMNREDVAAGLKGQKLRYAVLHHTGFGEAHFDLMVEVPGRERLLTWRIMDPPERWDGTVGAARIADHRKAYLTYEGEVSGGRGAVKRVAEGTARVVEIGSGWIALALSHNGRTARLSLGPG